MVDIVRPIYGEAWASSGEKLSPTEIKVQSGWVQEMMPYQWENFLQNRQDTTILYLLQKGVPEWSADQEYIGNKSIVTHNGYTYQAKSTNTGNLPTDSVYWKRTSPNVTDSGVVTLGSGGTGATNASDARANLGLGTAATVSADAIVFKSITGNAPAADKWTSPISLSLSGGATGTVLVDGSANATINVTGLNASSISSGTVPASALTNATLKTSPVGSTILAAGLTSERDLSPSEGYARWNKTTKVVEVFNGTSWVVNTSQSETYLLNRANHTGEQAISTVTGLQVALDAKASLTSVAASYVAKTSDTGIALLPEGDDAQRPATGSIPAGALVMRGNTQDPADYKPEFWNRVSGLWETFASRTWATTAVAALQDWVNEQIGFTIIYPNGGSQASPANVTVSTRYVMVNPFPGHHVICTTELLIGGKWGASRWMFNGVSVGHGVAAELFDGSIIVQTGAALTNTPATIGQPNTAVTSAVTAPTPCRVKVWKLKGGA